ncbi:hypothetical protein, partial [Aeromonas dhakensis]|uniref:hypothetical protein n=1 Tax=Aeromonas dhakensis TaxID=196024 RepID=UPI003BA09F21
SLSLRMVRVMKPSSDNSYSRRSVMSMPLRQGAWLYRRWRYAPLSPTQRQRTLRQLRRRLRQICRRWDAHS